nr:hypothetical protein [Tanacetum cinerariifolium]
MSFQQFELFLRQQFENRIAAHVIQTGPDGKALLSRDFLLYARDRLHMNYLQAQHYSKWNDAVFHWVSRYFKIQWPPMPPTAPRAPRTKSSRTPQFRGLDIRRLSTQRQISVNAMRIRDMQNLRAMVETRLAVPAGTYTLSYIKEGVRKALRNDRDLVTLKNTIDGVLVAQVDEF